MKLTDPIEGYQYPEDWIKRSSCSKRELKRKISSGFYILLQDGSFLRRGLTTGTTAAGVVKAAILSLLNPISEVDIMTPAGISVKINVNARGGFAQAIKDAGDHEFDATHGCVIEGVTVQKKGIFFGEGIGRFKNRYSFYKPGSPAVSPSAMETIKKAYIEACKETGIEKGVEIRVRNGKQLAKRTSNIKLGIEGGISILGTTGFVEPWCDKLIKMKAELVKNLERVVLATGRKGWDSGRRLFPNYTAVVIGPYLDEILPHATGKIRIVSMPSLIIKWAVEGKRDKILWKNPRNFTKKDANEILKKARSLSKGVVEGVYLINEKEEVIYFHESCRSWASSGISD